MATSRVAVVAWDSGIPRDLDPRGQRTAHVSSALAERVEVDRLGAASVSGWVAGDSGRVRTTPGRRFVSAAAHAVLIDKYELSARRHLRAWSPAVDGALLIGYPCSPLAYGSMSLIAHKVPYVVDIGDPWVLTNPRPPGGPMSRRRAAKSEHRLWTYARGAVVTTPLQAQGLMERYPDLRVMVRPNGVTEVPLTMSLQSRAPDRARRELRLVHYGQLYGERAPASAVLEALATSGRWERVSLTQYGPDWGGVLDGADRYVEVVRRSARPWPELVAEAAEFDAAVVIGWSNPSQMPSKALQYTSLPIPRIALTTSSAQDSLASFAHQRAGWLVLRGGQDGIALAVEKHVGTSWNSDALRPAEGDLWPHVANEVATFTLERLGLG